MNRILSVISFFVIVVSCTSSKIEFISDTSDYFPLREGLSWKYNYTTSAHFFIDSISGSKVKKLNNDYYLRTRTYYEAIDSIAAKPADSLYYRVENNNAIYLDKISLLESIELPGQVRLNQQWASADSNFLYKVKNLNTTLITPKRGYSDLIELNAIRYKNPDTKYYINESYYFAKGIGLVAITGDNELRVYLDK